MKDELLISVVRYRWKLRAMPTLRLHDILKYHYGNLINVSSVKVRIYIELISYHFIVWSYSQLTGLRILILP